MIDEKDAALIEERYRKVLQRKIKTIARLTECGGQMSRYLKGFIANQGIAHKEDFYMEKLVETMEKWDELSPPRGSEDL